MNLFDFAKVIGSSVEIRELVMPNGVTFWTCQFSPAVRIYSCDPLIPSWRNKIKRMFGKKTFVTLEKGRGEGNARARAINEFVRWISGKEITPDSSNFRIYQVPELEVED